jgi:hypothetical protein
MKLTKVLCIAALVAMSAAVANAGSIIGDPSLTVNHPPKGGFIANPLTCIGTCPGDEMVVLTYNGPTKTFTPGSPFDIFVLPGIVPDGGWVPASDIFGMIGSVPGPGGSQEFELFSGKLTRGETFDLLISGLQIGTTATVTFGSPVTCDSGANGGSCMDGVATFAGNTPVTTPEPSTMLLFFSLGPAIGFAKKRWSARQSG